MIFRAGIPVHGMHSLIRTCAAMRWHVEYKRSLQVDASEEEDLRCCCKKKIFRTFPRVFPKAQRSQAGMMYAKMEKDDGPHERRAC